jgi:hypothetical protein
MRHCHNCQQNSIQSFTRATDSFRVQLSVRTCWVFEAPALFHLGTTVILAISENARKEVYQEKGIYRMGAS